jgi:hypothetical protein
MPLPQRGAEYVMWGKVVASLEFGSWWILWIRSYPWLFLAPKVFQPCANYLVCWFCASLLEWVNFLSLFLVPSWSSNMPFYPSKVLKARERASNPLTFPMFPYLGLVWVYQGAWERIIVVIKKLHIIYYVYIDCVPNLLNPIIGSWLILIWNELCVTKSCHAHSKSFKLEFKIPKRLPPRRKLVIYVVLVIHHHFFA